MKEKDYIEDIRNYKYSKKSYEHHTLYSYI